jgi:hypothetical protein
MPPDLLHNHPQFADLIRIVAEQESIAPTLSRRRVKPLMRSAGWASGLHAVKLHIETDGP